jgi:pimeloyl-ACP methyl ester carboxylesterase
VSTPIEEHVDTDAVISADGTRIGYRQFGRGRAIVVLHGTMSSGYNHRELAEALADSFTVVVPDRRGRGLSGPIGSDYGLEREVEDVEALVRSTGARGVFGVSSGGIVALESALRLPALGKVAAFEPPFFGDSAAPSAILTRFDEEMAQGRIAAALVTAMKGAKMGPPMFGVLPRWLVERMTGAFMATEDRKPSNGYISMRALAPLLRYDFQIVLETSGRVEHFAAIRSDVLLLGGSKSPAYLKAALDDLGRVLPDAHRMDLPGLDHAASWNRDRGGHPGPVADALRGFFE